MRLNAKRRQNTILKNKSENSVNFYDNNKMFLDLLLYHIQADETCYIFSWNREVWWGL